MPKWNLFLSKQQIERDVKEVLVQAKCKIELNFLHICNCQKVSSIFQDGFNHVNVHKSPPLLVKKEGLYHVLLSHADSVKI